MSLDEALGSTVEAAVERALARRQAPPPLVYTIPAAAHALCTSPDTVRRLVADGVLPIVPHMGRRQVIPRSAVLDLVEAARTPEPT